MGLTILVTTLVDSCEPRTPDLVHVRWTAITAESTTWMPLERGLSYDPFAINMSGIDHSFLLRVPVRDSAHPDERYAVENRRVDCGRSITSLRGIWFTDSAGRILRRVSYQRALHPAPFEADIRADLLYCPIIDSLNRANHGYPP